MRGSAAVFIIGMFAAAVVGIAASFAMQSVALEDSGPGEVPDNTGEVAGAVKNELTSLEHAMQQQIGELTDSVDALNGEVLSLKKILQELNVRLSSAGSAAPVVAAGGEGQPVVNSSIGESINRVLDERDRRREEERAQEREQRATDMRERFKGMMTSRTERYAKEKDWDSAKTEQVKQIIGDYYEKMSELGGMMFGRRRGDSGGSDESREQLNQLREDTKAKLLQIVSEEEANELLQGGMGRGGRGGPGGGRGSR
jgi:TolA-binding protein